MINIDNELYKAFTEQFPIALKNDKDFLLLLLYLQNNCRKLLKKQTGILFITMLICLMKIHLICLQSTLKLTGTIHLTV